MNSVLVHMSSKMDGLLGEGWGEVVRAPYEKRLKEGFLVGDVNLFLESMHSSQPKCLVKPEDETLTVYGSNFYHDLAYHLMPEDAEALVVFDAHNDCCDFLGKVDAEEPRFTDWVAHATRKVDKVFGYGLMPNKNNLRAKCVDGSFQELEELYDNLELRTVNQAFFPIIPGVWGKKVHASVDLDVCSRLTDHPLPGREKILGFQKLKSCLLKLRDSTSSLSVDVCGIPSLVGYEASPETRERLSSVDYFQPDETIHMVKELKQSLGA